MEFKDFAQTEASALLERLTSAAQAATEKVREDYEAQLAALRGEMQGLREQIEKEAARAAALEGDLDTVIEAHKTVDGERQKTEEELRGIRDLLDKARREIVQLEEVLESEMAQKTAFEAALGEKTTAFDAVLADKNSVEQDLAAARKTIDALRNEQELREETIRQLETKLHQTEAVESALRKQAGDTNSLLQTLTSAADAATRKIREEANSEIAALRAQVEMARREGTKSGSGERSGREAELLTASVRAVTELGKAANMSELFGSLVQQLAFQFPRVAIFRMKGKHLEGERGSGLDASTDITKLVIPMSMDSLITRAANLGTIEDLAGSPPANQNSPLGGTPASAIALPIRFQGETLAVLYADSEIAWDAAMPAFATLVLQHTEFLMTRLTQEIKTLKELRDYAGMLLQEAEHMFLADVEAKRSEKERVHRLRETIACGRQLYSQRAALEGPLAAGLLDTQIEAIVNGEPTPFAKDLAVAVKQQHSKRTAS
jgi:hypothetical protein